MIRSKINESLKAKGIKGKELAKEVGISDSSMSLFLSGKMGLKIENIEKIFEVLKIELTIKEMTTDEIFKANQPLTLEVAKSLVGKRIACTSYEAPGNYEKIFEFVVSGFISEWDEAANRKCDANFESFQDYWASFMSEDKIEALKQAILVLDENSKWVFRCNSTDKYSYFKEPTFHGSDSDRPVFFVILD